MFRDRLNIFFLAVAQVILLSHSFIPHDHHHDDLVYNQFHYELHTDSRNKIESGSPINIDFSKFIHAGDQVTFTKSNKAKVVITKQTSQAVILNFNFSRNIEYFTSPQRNIFPSNNHITNQPPLCDGNSLRGPPSFIVV